MSKERLQTSLREILGYNKLNLSDSEVIEVIMQAYRDEGYSKSPLHIFHKEAPPKDTPTKQGSGLANDKPSVRMDVQLNNGSLELQGEYDE